ncbi:SMP-30/gluconolactonase/LRE family protein [Defluviimonas sp. SAOS-178_SWC]|uniref:SMP-30/gluconolactonase/LRE family protein n=1 Tax=Defluviimonas sp. SAOS-178_SWC TaxID=3121287 RepID=UPI003221B856
MTAMVYDPRPCELGEGAFWHPERGQLFWFDILGHRLLSRDATGPREWAFGECVSAAGWIDHDTLLIASETALLRFSLLAGERTPVVAMEADNPVTRSNDGRADPFGGFWIGTMGKRAEPGAGTIYRFFDGRLEPLFRNITIPNAICFAPDGARAYFADTAAQRIMVQALDAEGWPKGAPEVFVDLGPEGIEPDGAVTDSEGYLWNAQWGAGRVARYTPDGRFDRAIAVPARQVSCPAFGGAALDRLYLTTARQGMDAAALLADPLAGQTFVANPGIPGRPEPRIRLG